MIVDPGVWIAFSVALSAIAATVAPLFLNMLQGRREANKITLDAQIRKEEKAQDYKRQDEVALRLQQYTQAQAEANKLISDKVDVVHSLVNSNLTEAKRSELKALVALANMTREIVELRKAQSLPDNPETTVGLAEMDRAVVALKEELDARARQDAEVKEQLKAQAKTTVAAPLPPVTTPPAPAGPVMAPVVPPQGNPAGLEPIQVTVVNPDPVKVEVTEPKK